MTDKKITQLNNITGANLASNDEFVVVDISADETKAITRDQLFQSVPNILTAGNITGTAITQSSNDVTVGRLMVNGTAGLNTLTTPNLGDLTAYGYPTGFFSFGATAVNGPIVESGGMGIQLRRFGGGLEQAAKIVFDDNSDVMYVQQNYGGAKGSWRMVYDTGNIVGTVSFVGGANTGAAFEYFTGPNGQTYRYANGRQVCTNNNTAITTAPAAFVGAITKLDGDKMWTGRWRT